MTARRVWEGADSLRRMLVALDTLEPWPGNPRQGDVPELMESLRRFGQVRPILVRHDGRIVAGHHLVLAARELGWTHLAAIQHDFESEEEARAYLVADNRLPELGRIDDEALHVQLQALRTLEGTGYTERDRADLDRRLAKLRSAPERAEEEPPAPRDEPKSKLGEIYELGPHRLMCGDATVAGDLSRLMGDERADVVWTDPPYAIYGSASGLSASITDDKIVRPFFRDTLAAAEQWTPFFAPIFVCCDWRSWPSWWEVAKLTRVEPKNLIVWDKGGAGLGNNFANTYELVGYFLHLPDQKVMTAQRQSGIRPILKPNVIRANRPTGAERQHNAAKPSDLITEILDVSSKPGALVLDLFAGSGTTMIAAERAGRRANLMEIDPAYCDVIRQRYANLVDDQSLAP